MLHFDIGKAKPLISLFGNKSKLAKVLFIAWLTTVLAVMLVFMGMYSYFKISDFKEVSQSLRTAHMRANKKVLESNVDGAVRMLSVINSTLGGEEADASEERALQVLGKLEVYSPQPSQGRLFITDPNRIILMHPVFKASSGRAAVFLDDNGKDISEATVAAAASPSGVHVSYSDTYGGSGALRFVCFLRRHPVLPLVVCSEVDQSMLDSVVALNISRLRINLMLEMVFASVVFLVIISLTVFYIFRLSRSIKSELLAIIDFLEHSQKKEVLGSFSPDKFQFREFAIIAEAARGLAEKVKKLFDWLGRKVLEEETANQQKASLLAAISSDISTGIEDLRKSASELASANLSGSQRSQIDSISNSVTRLSTVLDNIKMAMRFDDASFSAIKRNIEPAKVAMEAFGIVESQAVAKGLSMVFAADGSVPPSIESDPVVLKQLLVNIYENALSFSRKGPVDCRLTVIGEKGSGRLVFTADNKTEVVSSEELDELRSYPGAKAELATQSLRLAVCSHLAEKLGGTSGVSSSEDKGTVFSLELPLKGA